MHSLLNNDFAPVTFRFGFIETSFPALCEVFTGWQNNLDKKFGLRTEFKYFIAPLASAFSKLELLTTPLDRYLLVETHSNWTAIFANGLRGNDVGGWRTLGIWFFKGAGLDPTHRISSCLFNPNLFSV
jgi:hypothetical protein